MPRQARGPRRGFQRILSFQEPEQSRSDRTPCRAAARLASSPVRARAPCTASPAAAAAAGDTAAPAHTSTPAGQLARGDCDACNTPSSQFHFPHILVRVVSENILCRCAIRAAATPQEAVQGRGSQLLFLVKSHKAKQSCTCGACCGARLCGGSRSGARAAAPPPSVANTWPMAASASASGAGSAIVGRSTYSRDARHLTIVAVQRPKRSVGRGSRWLQHTAGSHAVSAAGADHTDASAARRGSLHQG